MATAAATAAEGELKLGPSGVPAAARAAALGASICRSARNCTRRSPSPRQAALAANFGKPQTYVSKCGQGERRVDGVEFLEIIDAIGTDAASLVDELAGRS